MKTLFIKNLAEKIEPFFNLDLKSRENIVRCVLDELKNMIKESREECKIKLVGFGTFHVSILKPAHGRLRHFKTNQLIHGGQTGLKVKFIPCTEIKNKLKVNYGHNEEVPE